MHPVLRLAFALTIATSLPACRQSAPAAVTAPATASAAAAQADPAPAANCPDADFNAFLQRFEANAEAQRATTADVVTMDSIDVDALPEPKPISKQVPRAELKFPVMPAPGQRQAEGLQQTVRETAPGKWEVKLAVADSGVQTRFSFEAKPCWTLVRISDDTI